MAMVNCQLGEEQDRNKNSLKQKHVSVFTCKNCHIVLGDSLAFACSQSDLGVIAVHAAYSVQVLQETTMSREGKDVGSAFSPVQCGGCKVEVGRLYRTTPRALDAIRDLISLFTREISTHQVGTYSVYATEDGVVKDASGSVPDSARLTSHEEQLFKVKAMLLMHNDHLAQLEEFRNKMVSALPALTSPQLSNQGRIQAVEEAETPQKAVKNNFVESTSLPHQAEPAVARSAEKRNPSFHVEEIPASGATPMQAGKSPLEKNRVQGVVTSPASETKPREARSSAVSPLKSTLQRLQEISDAGRLVSRKPPVRRVEMRAKDSAEDKKEDVASLGEDRAGQKHREGSGREEPRPWGPRSRGLNQRQSRTDQQSMQKPKRRKPNI